MYEEESCQHGVLHGSVIQCSYTTHLHELGGGGFCWFLRDRNDAAVSIEAGDWLPSGLQGNGSSCA